MSISETIDWIERHRLSGPDPEGWIKFEPIRMGAYLPEFLDEPALATVRSYSPLLSEGFVQHKNCIKDNGGEIKLYLNNALVVSEIPDPTVMGRLGYGALRSVSGEIHLQISSLKPVSPGGSGRLHRRGSQILEDPWRCLRDWLSLENDGFYALREGFDPNIRVEDGMGVIDTILTRRESQAFSFHGGDNGLWRCTSLMSEIPDENSWRRISFGPGIEMVVLDLFMFSPYEKYPHVEELATLLLKVLLLETATRLYYQEAQLFRFASEIASRESATLKRMYASNVRNSLSGELDLGIVYDKMSRWLTKQRYPEIVEIWDVDTPIPQYLIYALINIVNHTPDRDPARGLTGVEFERETAQKLRELDYEVSETPTTGDFGADLIAEKDDLIFVIQCKAHQRPIGVKAIQEAATAVRYYKGDYAVVVSVSGYTRAAEELAVDLGVHITDLARLGSLDAL